MKVENNDLDAGSDKRVLVHDKLENGNRVLVSGLGTRGRSIVGTVISSRAQKTVSVQWFMWNFLKKYDRYVKRKSCVKAHVPDGFVVSVGDVVLVRECRPLSKTKKFLVVEKRGRDFSYLTSQDQLREAAAVRDAKARRKVDEDEENRSRASGSESRVSSPKSQVSSEGDDL